MKHVPLLDGVRLLDWAFVKLTFLNLLNFVLHKSATFTDSPSECSGKAELSTFTKYGIQHEKIWSDK